MWLRWVCGVGFRPAMSAIMRSRRGLTVVVSLMESSILGEGDDTSILRTGLSAPRSLSSQPATASRLLPPRSGLERSDFVLCPEAADDGRAEHVRSARVA